ncbi:MAG: CehA/McbA family metallohydrolase [Candidatus Eisenbacteria bacterium]
MLARALLACLVCCGAAAASVHVRLLEGRGDGIPGPASAGVAGDVLLENDRIRVVVSAPSHALGETASGGWIIDAAPVGGTDCWGQASFVLVDSIGTRHPRHVRMEIIHPSGRGSPGGVRFVGEDSRLDVIRVDTEYLLAPGDPFVQVRTVYYWAPRGGGSGLAAFDRIAIGRTEAFLSGPGFLREGEPPGRGVPPAGGALLLVGEPAVYGWSSTAVREILGPIDGMMRVRLEPELPEARRLVFERRFYVAEGDPALVQGWIEGGSRGAVVGRVAAKGSDRPLAGATVEFRDGTGLRSAAFTRTDGTFRAELAPGSYTALALAAGGGDGKGRRVQAVSGEERSIDLEAEEPASIRFRIEDERGVLVPGRLTVRDRSGRAVPRMPGRLSITERVFAEDGLGVVRVPPGEYTLVASRGIAYSADEQRVKLRAGEIEEVSFLLRKEAGASGLAAVDLRVHTAEGLGGPATPEEQAVAALAEGLDALVFADNGRVFQGAPFAAGEKLVLIPGEEIVLDGVGRFGAFPLTPEEEIPPRGGYGAEGKAPSALFSLLRSGPSLPLIQVHAPRRGGTGYFENARLDPVTGLSANIEFERGFDLIEVADAQRIDEASRVLADWFHLLDQGRRVFATGNSGAGGRGAGGIGVPRNCVDREGFDQTLLGLIDSIRAGRFFFTTGPVLRFRANGGGRSGDLIQDGDGLVEIALRVEAAPWIEVESVRIFANGAVLLERTVNRREGALVIDLREDLPISRDTWLVAVASGSRALDPIYEGPRGERIFPVAVTNPIWVDFDGDGAFTPPGVRRGG